MSTARKAPWQWPRPTQRKRKLSDAQKRAAREWARQAERRDPELVEDSRRAASRRPNGGW